MQIHGVVTPSDTQDSGLLRDTGIVALGTLASRLLGAVRDAVIAANFSVFSTDTFFLAFTIPNAFRVLLGEGAASGALLPVLSEAREQGGFDRLRRCFS